ncbi:ATP cone domain-containing protein [Gaoshiqia sediminis]|uniref:ATP cone domain-containing protein n=1 Tax=Gaoshiqia sediminis TaxID=2986998 RepID=A0AA41Y3W1_9BACT|nr:ATP cone domain-containing protein [Gaoshiqia sediminis]MCW0482976.1 ATP cone domain-containing protein [Gaoshiqia sediminis]
MSQPTYITIRKASGDAEQFDVDKLKRSLQRAGAEPAVIDEIADEVVGSLYDGITTKKIYARAFSLLRRKNRVNAFRYKLKQALFELGPTGYPFEQFVGEIFKCRDYRVEVGQVLEGRCITHEMDVIATNGTEQVLVECKYSKDQGKQVSIQVPLYVHSRIGDIVQKRKDLPEYRGFSFTGGVATNTRFTDDSMAYSRCVGLKLLGWDFPGGNGLKDLMERYRVFPVTVLENLIKKQKTRLLELGVVTCRQLRDKPEVWGELGLSSRKTRQLTEELEQILGF